MNKKLIAKKLIKLRGEKTQFEVAKDVGISLSALAMYETGNRVPRDEIKVKLAKYYGTTVESLFFNSEMSRNVSITSEYTGGTYERVED